MLLVLNVLTTVLYYLPSVRTCVGRGGGGGGGRLQQRGRVPAICCYLNVYRVAGVFGVNDHVRCDFAGRSGVPEILVEGANGSSAQ